ncbi:MAG: HAD family hydrolase [Bdellovibrionales bacterium]|nr:HAD family hydrolase [Bdellovibrionales bacterium]
MQKAVILDRDGTLIIDKIYLNDPKQVFYYPDVFEALRLLRDHQFIFIGATNQSGVARGLVEIDKLYQIHEKIRADMAYEGIDFREIYYAPYMTETKHFIRKPQPGMILRAAYDYNLDLKKSWMVGDRMIDVEAGHRAGCRSAMVGFTESPQHTKFRSPEIYAETLLEVAQQIVKYSD